MSQNYIEAAEAWLAQDPDETTREELRQIIESRDFAALAERFSSRLSFGTAGLRGELGAGPNRMNRVLVAQAAAGIGNYLKNQGESKPSIVIGYDGRINSDVFAKDSARILAGLGLKVFLFNSMVPTPVLAFAGRYLNTSAAIMVTASHNPPRDNGYKVYLGGNNGGSQIVSPTDKHIASEIEKVAESLKFSELPKSNDFEIIGDEMRDAYISRAASLIERIENPDALNIVYTALHGVGWHIVNPLFSRVGLNPPITVAEQLYPDGNFPTVDFPNPEEPGAMDLAFAKARTLNADLIIANDPDADRLAVAVPAQDQAAGWRRLTGDELGLLLADLMAEKAVKAGQTGTLACSIVSSSALGKVAQFYGLDFKTTLTGFKWISKVPNLIFGYEEALGYCADINYTPDKDGISAALLITELAHKLASEGKSLSEHLAELGARYGYFETGQISIRVKDLSLIKKLMERFRENPPRLIDGAAAEFTDLAWGSEQLPATDGLLFELDDNRRVIIRPSGTEPKLKCYLQAVGDSRTHAKTKLSALENQMRKLLEI